MKLSWVAMIAGIAAVLTLGGIGFARLFMEHTRWGGQVIQRSCGQGPLAEFCVERYTVPAIPLLRDERRTVDVHARQNLGRFMSMPDPFVSRGSDVSITWTNDAAILTDPLGFTLTLDKLWMNKLHD
jgi:hypothetical protein